MNTFNESNYKAVRKIVKSWTEEKQIKEYNKWLEDINNFSGIYRPINEEYINKFFNNIPPYEIACIISDTALFKNNNKYFKYDDIKGIYECSRGLSDYDLTSWLVELVDGVASWQYVPEELEPYATRKEAL